MNVKKPEQPSCSSLTERQWRCIVDNIEYAWDLGQVRTSDLNRDILRDISALSVMSLITPEEVNILKKYNEDCRRAYVEECEKLKVAIAARCLIASDNRCVCCGEIIPEGRQVCLNCERSPEDDPLIIKAVDDLRKEKTDAEIH